MDAYLQEMGQRAKAASLALANLSAPQRRHLLQQIAACLHAAKAQIVAANQQDMQAAETAGLAPSMLDRLRLDDARLLGVINDIATVALLADPLGQESDARLLDNGLRLCRRRVPLGVIGVIYEARPNVTVDIAVLALKTGNAVILRGGKETLATNRALLRAIRQGLSQCQLPEDSVQLIDNPDRQLVTGLLRLDQYVDMIVPRGGPQLQRLCAEQATIPVILGGVGICHLYLDKAADLSRATSVIVNAKVQRPTVCNALDTLLIHQQVAAHYLPTLAATLTAAGVQLVGCENTRRLLPAYPVAIADEQSYGTEWLSLTLGIKVVTDIDAAIAHIRHYSSGHSEAILTDDVHAASRFLNEVDAAAVYLNASTRFTDGGQFGLGAEVAVSTQKLHARGPMGLEALTTYKWIGVGDYSVRR